MDDLTLIESAEARIATRARLCHDKRHAAAEALEHWQNEGEKIHPHLNCDHEWVIDETTCQCNRCGWQQTHREDT